VTLEELRYAGFEVGAGEYARLDEFVELLLRENKRVNLTAVRSAREVWRLHVCDSLALLPLIRQQGVRRLLDLGSGGGLPAVPLACVCPELHVTSLDATRKKAEAVGRVIDCLGLPNAEAAWGRAEELGHDPARREVSDAVTARAVAALPVLVEYAAGFVRPGGYCWFYKSAKAADQERTAAESAARACRLEDAGVVVYRLPGESQKRAIICYRKSAHLDAELPRRPGRPAKRPL